MIRYVKNGAGFDSHYPKRAFRRFPAARSAGNPYLEAGGWEPCGTELLL